MLVRKSIVFNTADPDQNDLVKHAELRTNFSGYVKRLIQRDMEGCNFLRDVENWRRKGGGIEANSHPMKCPVRTLYARRLENITVFGERRKFL